MFPSALQAFVTVFTTLLAALVTVLTAPFTTLLAVEIIPEPPELLELELLEHPVFFEVEPELLFDLLDELLPPPLIEEELLLDLELQEELLEFEVVFELLLFESPERLPTKLERVWKTFLVPETTAFAALLIPSPSFLMKLPLLLFVFEFFVLPELLSKNVFLEYFLESFS